MCLALLYVYYFFSQVVTLISYSPRSYSEGTDDNFLDGGGDTTNNPRSFFFSPSEVLSQIANSSRSCVLACCELLGYKKGDNKAPNWKQALQAACPKNAVICSFESAKDLVNLPSETLDSLM